MRVTVELEREDIPQVYVLASYLPYQGPSLECPEEGDEFEVYEILADGNEVGYLMTEDDNARIDRALRKGL